MSIWIGVRGLLRYYCVVVFILYSIYKLFQGYALIEYEKQKEAAEAIRKMNGKTLLDKVIGVSWAFSSK